MADLQEQIPDVLVHTRLPTVHDKVVLARDRQGLLDELLGDNALWAVPIEIVVLKKISGLEHAGVDKLVQLFFEQDVLISLVRVDEVELCGVQLVVGDLLDNLGCQGLSAYLEEWGYPGATCDHRHLVELGFSFLSGAGRKS